MEGHAQSIACHNINVRPAYLLTLKIDSKRFCFSLVDTTFVLNPCTLT
jgi:hypothetical protein